jgi:hypothetical protein
MRLTGLNLSFLNLKSCMILNMLFCLTLSFPQSHAQSDVTPALELENADSSNTHTINAPILPEPTPLKLFILHGGMADPANDSTQNIARYIMNSGFPQSQVVVLPNPYPDIKPDLNNLQEVFKNIRSEGLGDFLKSTIRLTKENVKINWDTYRDSSELNSPVTQTAYKHLLDVLRQKEQEFPQRKLMIQWVGLSAGGQMGLTLAKKLADDASSEAMSLKRDLQLQTITTLGSPIIENQAPKEIKIISCVSQQDEIWRQSTRPGAAKVFIGREVLETPPNRDENDEVREFTLPVQTEYNISEGHNLWHKDTAILSKALAGVVP